jgi:hypothetical protein
MTQPDVQNPNGTPSVSDASSLEGTLRRLFAERTRWRELRDQAQAEFSRLNREVLRVSREYCTDEARELEYRRCVERLTGFDPYISPEQVAEAERTGGPIDDILRGLEEDAAQEAKGA